MVTERGSRGFWEADDDLFLDLDTSPSGVPSL